MDELQVRRQRPAPPAPPNRRTRASQAQRRAEDAKRKVSRRREKQSGAAAWVSDRAGQWSLDGPDWQFIERQKYLWNPLMDYWFRMDIEGWELLPDPPTLLIGIHSTARSATPSGGGMDTLARRRRLPLFG